MTDVSELLLAESDIDESGLQRTLDDLLTHQVDYGEVFLLPACSCSLIHFMCLPGKSPLDPSKIKDGADSIFLASSPQLHLLVATFLLTNFSNTCPLGQ